MSACSDPIASWRKPELPTCERFIRAGLRVPSSYSRAWYNIADFPVSRALLAEATGDPRQAAAAPSPAIRRVYINYQASGDSDGSSEGDGFCLFPMTDAANGIYAGDNDKLIDAAIAENERRALRASQGESVISVDCCTVEAFDRAKLMAVTPVARGSVPKARKL